MKSKQTWVMIKDDNDEDMPVQVEYDPEYPDEWCAKMLADGHPWDISSRLTPAECGKIQAEINLEVKENYDG